MSAINAYWRHACASLQTEAVRTAGCAIPHGAPRRRFRAMCMRAVSAPPQCWAMSPPPPSMCNLHVIYMAHRAERVAA